MKKITLLMLVLLTSLSWRSTAQFFTEGFEGTFPGTWTHTQLNATETWYFSTASFNTGTQSLQCDYDANTQAQNEVLMSPVINLSTAVNPRLKFSFLTSYYWLVDPNNNADISVEATTDGGVTKTELWTEANQGEFTNWVWYQVEVNLAAYAGNANFQLILRYEGTDAAQANFDDIVVEETPTCIPPTALTATNITTTSADLSWTPDASGSAWNVEWGMAPLTQGGGTLITGATNPQAISGLTPGTSYSYYVQTNCGTEVSAWAGPYTFSTLCNATDVPYSVNFNEVTAPALPNCTENVNEGTGNNWTTAATPSSPTGFTGNVLRYSYNGANAANTWFFTNGLNLTAGTSYTVSYKYANNSTSYAENLKIAYGVSKNGAAMTNVIADYPGIQDAILHTAVNTFTPATSGVYYIGFQAYSAADMWNLYVDDIEVYVTPACPAPTAFAIGEITATSAAFSWTAGGSETAWEIVYGAPGFNPATAGTVVAAGTNPYTLTGLTDGNDYEAYIRSVCSASSSSIWAGPVAWASIDAPDCASNPTPADAATDIPVGSVQFMWEPAATGGPADAYKFYYGLTPTTVTNLVGTYTDNFVTLNVSGYNTTIYWMIVPVNSTGEATGCAVWSFTTEEYVPPVCTVTEYFEATTIPTGWSTVVNTGTCDFAFGSGNMPFGPDFPTGAAIFDDDACGDGEAASNVSLLSPVYDLTGATSATLSYDIALQVIESETFVVEVYNGTSWVQVASYNADLAAITNASIDVLSYANSAFQVRFTYNDAGTWGWGAGVDNFCINTNAPALGIEDAIVDGFMMYPNPANNTLNINALNKIDSISVFNMLGQEVLSVNPNATQVQLDLTKVSNGAYIVKVQAANQVGAYNLIKQ